MMGRVWVGAEEKPCETKGGGVKVSLDPRASILCEDCNSAWLLTSGTLTSMEVVFDIDDVSKFDAVGKPNPSGFPSPVPDLKGVEEAKGKANPAVKGFALVAVF